MDDATQALWYAEKSLRSVCVVLIDLDHFKRINDNYGHAAGDAVLIRFVGVCRMHLRSVDVFGRLGGEEFGLVLPECSLEDGLAIVDRMRATIAATPFDTRIPENIISASFGLASTAGSGYSLPVLMGASRIYFLDDAKHFAAPESYAIQYFAYGTWRNVGGKPQGKALANGVNELDWAPVTARKFRVLLDAPPGRRAIRLLEWKLYAQRRSPAH